MLKHKVGPREHNAVVYSYCTAQGSLCAIKAKKDTADSGQNNENIQYGTTYLHTTLPIQSSKCWGLSKLMQQLFY